jgi:proprotein convertase subtilisin/kexin type 5
VCPLGLYGDKLTGMCESCNYACTECFGASSTECYDCLDFAFILLGTECRKPSCVSTQFFDWATETCMNCHEDCRTCTERAYNDCKKCHLGELFERNDPTSTSDYSGYCYPCEDI